MAEAIILLDGAMGTELAARGFSLEAPLFSARALIDAPELVEQIHFDYLLAGAQVLTTNSFGLHASTLARAGIGEQQEALVGRALEILENVRRRALAQDRGLARFRVAGSIPPRPLEDRDSAAAIGRAEYRAYADRLARAGVDLILLETFTTIAEIELAVAGVAATEGLPVWLSVAAGAPGASNRPDGTRLIGGDALADLGPFVERVDALLINCTQIDAVPAALDSLLAVAGDGLLGLCPHLGKRRYDGVWIDRIVDAEVFAEQMHAWLIARPSISLAGACCGSRPDDVAAMRQILQPDAATREQAWTHLAQLVP